MRPRYQNSLKFQPLEREHCFASAANRYFHLAWPREHSEEFSMRIALVTVFAMALPFSAQAGLRFEATSVEIKPEPGEPQVVAKFPFKNTSDKNVTIFATESDCGCTTAGLEKKEYSPGEAGTITATFAIGDRTGAQVKQIRVRASDQS